MTKSHGFRVSAGHIKPSRKTLMLLVRRYKVNLHWLLTGEGVSGLEPDTVPIEFLSQQAAAGQGRDVEDYPEKQIFQVPRSVTLISANPAYPPRCFSGPELETIQITGRVVATIHRV
jgi:phage repressor protein C with HTH and peptisase S24 domain